MANYSGYDFGGGAASDWSQPSSWTGQGGGDAYANPYGLGGAPQAQAGAWQLDSATGQMMSPSAMMQQLGMAGMPAQTGQQFDLSMLGGSAVMPGGGQSLASLGGMVPQMLQSAGIPQPAAQAQAAPAAAAAKAAPAANAPASSQMQSAGSGGNQAQGALPNIPGMPGYDPNKPPGYGGTNEQITTTVTPWGPQGDQLKNLYKEALEEYNKQEKAGPIGFTQESKDALNRMENLARAQNPMVNRAVGAVSNVASGQEDISQSFYNQLFNKPGTAVLPYQRMANEQAQTGLGRYEDLYRSPAVTQQAINQYGQMSKENPITGLDQYNQMTQSGGIGGIQQYQQMARENAITGIGEFNPIAARGGMADVDIDRARQMAGDTSTITGIDQYNPLASQGGMSSSDINRYRQMSNQDAITNESMYRGIANQNIGSQAFNRIGAQAAQPGSLEKGMFNQLAQGDLVGANPYREANIKQAMNDTAAQVKATMSAKGRYGSDAYGDAMGKALSSVATQAREAGYDKDTANTMAAAVARSGEIQGRQGIGLSAAQGGLSTAQANKANQLAAAQGISSLQGQNQAAQLAALQGMTGAQGQRANTQLAAMAGRGSAQMQNAQQQLAAQGQLANTQTQRAQTQLAGLTGRGSAQAQNQAAQLAALTGMTGAQNAATQNRLAALAGRGEAQLSNQQSQLAALQGQTQAQVAQQQQQLAAQQAFNQAQQGNQAQQFQALQGLTGAQGQNVQQQLAAAQGIQGVQGQNIQNMLAAAGMAPQMNDLRYADAQKLMGVGQARQAEQQQQQQFGWDQVARLQGAIGGLPGQAGTKTEPGQPWWQTAAGLGLLGLGGLGGMFG